jgi:polar amino acid transport system substrate-binding protein
MKHPVATLAVLALTTLSLVLPGRALADSGSDAPGSVRLRIGTNAVYPPLTFRRGDQLAGIEIDLAHKLARELGIEVELIDMAWEDLIPALRDGRIDVIMSGMSITPERRQLVQFSLPYLRIGQMALIRRKDAVRLREPSAMGRPESRVGFERGTTGERFARERLKDARLVGFETPAEGIASLRAGEIDFFIHDAPTVWRTVGGLESTEQELTGLYRTLTDEQLAWAVRKGDRATLELLNRALARWRNEGELELIMALWIRVRRRALEPRASPSGVTP